MKYRLDLKPESDGYGYIYGQLYAGDQLHSVNIMPPEAEWRGQVSLEGQGAPHETDFVIFLDGEEIARVRRREDIEASLVKGLIPPSR